MIPATSLSRKTQGLIGSTPGQAAADRIAAAQIAAASSRSRPRREIRTREIALLAAVLLSVALFAAILRGTKQSSEFAASSNMHRGRVASLSAPHGTFEYASVAKLIEVVEPSVVQIETKYGLGSGFVLDPSGLIVTCNHCLEHAFDAEVVFADGTRAAVLGAANRSPTSDVAILVIKPTQRLIALPLVKLLPRKGDPIVAIGSPFGLSFSESEGSVSGIRTVEELNRIPRLSINVLGLSRNVTLVQITASTMPGNSGGPVVDLAGNVVGISSFGLDWQGQMYEFCISANEIRQLASHLSDDLEPLWTVDPELPDLGSGSMAQ